MPFIDSTKFRFTFSRLWSPTQTEDSGQQKADSRRRITLLWAGTDREQLPRTLPWPLLVACHSCLCYYPCCRCCCCCLFIIICTENVRSGCAFFIAFFDIVLLPPFYFYLFLVAPLSVSFYTRLRECVSVLLYMWQALTFHCHLTFCGYFLKRRLCFALLQIADY